MKKIIFTFLFALLIFTPNVCLSASATDGGVYSISQKQQINSDREVKNSKQDSQTQTSQKNRFLGNFEDFSMNPLSFFSQQKTSEGVNNSLSDDAGSAEKIPDGVEGSNFIRDNLLPSGDSDAKDGTEGAGIVNTSKTKKKRERALVELATFGYALASINKTQAAKNLSGKKSIDKSSNEKTNQTKTYGASVSDNTNVKMSSLQVYNAIILTSATNNMINAISAGDYVSNTSNTLNDIMFSSFGSAAGSVLGSFLE